MRKKSYASRLGVLAVALTLVTTCLVGGTMAKYTTTAAGTSKTTVANFNVKFKAGNTELESTSSKELNLFALNRNDIDKNVVKDNKLAPGINGWFDIVVTNNSDVMIKVSDFTVTAGENNAPIPVKYNVSKGTTQTTAPSDFNVESAALGDAIKGNFDTIGWDSGNNAKTVRVWWSWVTDSNKEDTSYLGDGKFDYNLDISMTAEQVLASEVKEPNTP